MLKHKKANIKIFSMKIQYYNAQDYLPDFVK